MIKNVWFDDAATLAMGEAFDNACKSLQNFGSAVPAIVADRIIDVAKNGERDPARLYEQALKAFGIEDMSVLVVSVGRDPVPAAYASVAHAACTTSLPALPPPPGAGLSFFTWLGHERQPHSALN